MENELTHLHKCHLRAKREKDFLCFSGVRIVPVFVEPLFQRPGHVLQSLPFMPYLSRVLTRPVEKKKKQGYINLMTIM